MPKTRVQHLKTFRYLFKSSDTGSDSVSENASATGNPLGFEPESVHAVGLFDVNNAETDCAL
ncbi:MAG: hypothetical protein ACLT8Y_13725 [Dorea formicigenerans]